MLSFPHSLATNNLVGETGYIKTSEVQGSSFEVGAKVTYEGREMTVRKAPDSHGEMRMIDLSGCIALAACLPECGLTSLKCAAATPKCLLSCQRPLTRLYSLTVPILPLARSLESNGIGDEGASSLAAVLKETVISDLKCAATRQSVCFRVSGP